MKNNSKYSYDYSINKIFGNKRYKDEIVEGIIIKNRSIITRSGLVFNRYGLVNKSVYNYPVAYIKFVIFSILSLFKRKLNRINKPVGVIHTSWTLGYYHWLTESVPRLIKLKKQYPTVSIYLPSEFKKYEIYFDILGYEKPIYYDECNIMTGNVYLASCPTKMAVFNEEVYNYTRDLLRSLIKYDNTKIRKIYITRQSARGRRVINEDDVKLLLLSRGYEIYDFDQLSIKEQQSICCESKVIISIHGAALTNMLFMAEGSRVIELIPQKRSFFREFNFVRFTAKHDPCFYRLANTLGHNYDYLECYAIDEGRRMSHMDDIEVNINILTSLLESAVDEYK